jgi:hypothetical protein
MSQKTTEIRATGIFAYTEFAIRKQGAIIPTIEKSTHFPCSDQRFLKSIGICPVMPPAKTRISTEGVDMMGLKIMLNMDAITGNSIGKGSINHAVPFDMIPITTYRPSACYKFASPQFKQFIEMKPM